MGIIDWITQYLSRLWSGTSRHKEMDLADDAWASLLPYLLLEIIRRLETTAIIRCAATCKPWRRAIISNALSLRHPRPDSFVPSLHLGFFPGYIIGDSCPMLYSMPAPCQPVLPEPNEGGCCTFVPPVTSGIRGGELLSSRDGFLLVKRRRKFNPICLWNPVAGTSTFLPLPSFACETYILLSDYDDLPGSSSSNKPELRILAVQESKLLIHSGGSGGRWSFHYQLFSAGTWGPVERSQELPECISVHMRRGTKVVCRRGAVHWLAWSFQSTLALDMYACAVALDLGTGRTWTTELPTWWRLWEPSRYRLDLATSRDGLLSVIRLLDQQQIQVWVLSGGDQWFLRRVVFVRELIPDVQDIQDVSVRVFCPRRGCVLVQMDRQQFLVDVDKGSSRRVQGSFPRGGAHPYPYEMDWSAYWTICLSKMKHF